MVRRKQVKSRFLGAVLLEGTILDFKGYGWVFFEGLKITLAVALCSAPVAVLMGLLGAWGKLSKSAPPTGSRMPIRPSCAACLNWC